MTQKSEYASSFAYMKIKKENQTPRKKEFLGTGKGEECSVHTQKFHNEFH